MAGAIGSLYVYIILCTNLIGFSSYRMAKIGWQIVTEKKRVNILPSYLPGMTENILLIYICRTQQCHSSPIGDPNLGLHSLHFCI